jgi:hypothetical protein
MERRPLLVAFHGVKRSGKDTAASFLEEWASGRSLSFKRRGFADKAKWAWARQFNPEVTMQNAIDWVDVFKDRGSRVKIEHSDGRGGVDIDFRQCMAQFATEGARLIYGEDHWVDLLLPTSMYIDGQDLPTYPKWHDSFAVFVHLLRLPRVADVCAIHDMRFDNELQRVRTLGGVNVKIRRKQAEDAVLAEASHRGLAIHESELGLPDEEFDYVVPNDGTLDDFRVLINSLAVAVMQDESR